MKVEKNAENKAKPSRRWTYNAGCKTYRKTKLHIKSSNMKKVNENNNGKKKLVGPLISGKQNFLLKGVSAGNWWV